MTWVGATSFARRPLVIVEDHLHHVSELLEALEEAEEALPRRATVVCLDRSGPDTTLLVAAWLERYPGLQVAASFGAEGGDVPAPLRTRRAVLDPAAFEGPNRFCKA